MIDSLQRFLLRGAPVRGELVSLDLAWRDVLARHELPDNVSARLGELSAAGLLLAASLKFEGKLVLQIHGDGPVSLVVVECDPDGRFRATARLREDGHVPPHAGLRELVDAHGGGRCVVTLDPRKRTASQQPWQGIVPFEGNSVSEILERYMARSEQVPTRLWLAADGQRAVGLLLQKLPEEGGHAAADTDIDGWNRLQHLADTLSARDLLGLTPDEVIKRLFWQESLHAFDRRDCRFECTCSRDKVGGMLKMLGAAEIESILEEQGQVEVRCDFCNEAWRLDAVDCARLFVSEPTGEAPPRQQ